MQNNIILEKIACPLCNIDSTTRVFTGKDRLCKKEGEFDVVKCERCKLTYINPRPTQETMSHYYPSDYAPYHPFSSFHVSIYGAEKKLCAKIKSELKGAVLADDYGYEHLYPSNQLTFLNKLPRFFRRSICFLSYIYFKKNYYRIPFWKEHGRALDIGCGNGAYLLLLRRMGWDAVGVDISNNVADEVRNANIQVLIGDIRSLDLESESFHIISMWHALEHLHSPFDTLKEIWRLLTNDGIVFIEVPNCAGLIAKLFGRHWFAWDVPRHLFHFSPETISGLLERTGFRNIKIRHLRSNNAAKSLVYLFESRGFDFNIDQLLKYRLVSRAFRMLGRGLALFRSGDIIFVEARKS